MKNPFIRAIGALSFTIAVGHADDSLVASMIAIKYASGNGVQQDYTKAAIYALKGCEGGNAMGCSLLGIMYARGDGVQQDYAKASIYALKGCDGGDAKGCIQLGSMYANGEGIRQDKTKAKALFGRACDLHDNEYGCKNYAILNSKGY